VVLIPVLCTLLLSHLQFQVMLLGEHSASLCHKALLVELQIMSATYSHPATCTALRKARPLLRPQPVPPLHDMSIW
jgi:hypothetical protein